jgi:diguanylate cyclase (GGDEF)-like protein
MRIALVEPSRTNRTIVSRLLQEGGHEVRSFEDGPEALEALASDATLNAVITGSELKSISGLELVWEARLLSGPRRFLHILFMSSLRDEAAVSEALDSGADDFIAKPPSPRELRSRLRAAERIANLQSELMELAFTDPLTGVLNRRGFFEAVTPIVSDASVAFSAMLLDLDFLKEINDLYGHDTGDVAIRTLAGVLREKAGVAGRMGGDEFALLLPAHCLKDAADLGEAIRRQFSAARLRTRDGSVSLSCSIGVAELTAGKGLDHLLAQADLALYHAKEGGRDKVSTPPSHEWIRGNARARNRVARSSKRPNRPPLDADTGVSPQRV